MEPGSPPGGDTPDEVLGAERSESSAEVGDRRDEPIGTYEQRKADARRDDDERFKRPLDGIEGTDAAWSWIRQNHESTAETAAASGASAVRAPYSVLGVSSEESFGEIEAGRGDPLRQELEKLSVETDEFDRLRFRRALTNVRATDEVYDRPAAEEPTDGRA